MTLTREQSTALRSPARSGWAAGSTGIIAAAVALATAELVSLLLGGRGNPILSVGSLLIDLVPPAVKSAVIALFDTADKLFLFIVLGTVVLALAALAGVLESRRPFAGIALGAVVAGIAVVAAVTRADATWLDAVPTIVGVLGGGWLLRELARRLTAWRTAPPRRATTRFGAGTRFERRSFLRLAGITGVAALVVGSGARLLSAASSAVSEARAALNIPEATTPSDPIPAGADLEIDGLAPYITPNADFYRIDTALQVPAIDPADWSLRITGMVDEEIELTWAQLLELPLEEHVVTLTCVSNEVGGSLIGNALWRGYPIRELLARARPQAGADMVLSTSVDGFTAGTPLEVLQDDGTDAILAVAMNGEPLPLEHGFPARLVVPGLYGYVSATKWVTELEVTTFAADEGYWTPRGWDALGPIKIGSRIDVPRRGAAVTSGTVAIAGVAWAQHTGIAGVEVRIDEGEWRPARLASAVSDDTWVQWVLEWPATSGRHTIAVRATDANGDTQTSDAAAPAPNGASGWHTIEVDIA